MAEISATLGRLRGQNRRSADLAEVLRLRRLMASVAVVGATSDQSLQSSVAQALGLLDAVLDSPLDLDASLFDTIHSTLEPVSRGGTAEIALQMRQVNRLLQRQVRQVQQGRPPVAIRQARREPVEVPCPPSPNSAPGKPAGATRSAVRGFHIRQAGHDFVLPVDWIEGAFAAEVDQLPTVHGRAVADYSGELCDVIRLAGYLGLMNRADSSPKTLVVIAKSGVRVCLAVDEVVGPVETAVTPMESVLPKVTGLQGVAVLKSGGLALVPDLSRLLSNR